MAVQVQTQQSDEVSSDDEIKLNLGRQGVRLISAILSRNSASDSEKS